MNWNPKQVRPEIAILYRRIVDSLNQKEPEGLKSFERSAMHLEAFIKSQTSSTEVKKELPGFAINAADKETTSKANVPLANCPTYGLSQDVTGKLPVSSNGEDKTILHTLAGGSRQNRAWRVLSARIVKYKVFDIFVRKYGGQPSNNMT